MQLAVALGRFGQPTSFRIPVVDIAKELIEQMIADVTAVFRCKIVGDIILGLETKKVQFTFTNTLSEGSYKEYFDICLYKDLELTDSFMKKVCL